MSIARLLQDSALEPAVHEGLRLAFSGTLRLLGLVDRNDPVCEIVACKIVEIGATGASDPIAISDIAVRQLSAFIADRKKPRGNSQISGVISQDKSYRLVNDDHFTPANRQNDKAVRLLPRHLHDERAP